MTEGMNNLEAVPTEKLKQDLQRVLEKLESFAKSSVLTQITHFDEGHALLEKRVELVDKMIEVESDPAIREGLLTQKRMLNNTLSWSVIAQKIKDVLFE
ncbi:hypothetical protein HZA86_01350 [Candidatus Uhrbacteria bacterium]|nr:hypothetical protein [Candidatus Uhrbacteria bacterium]